MGDEAAKEKRAPATPVAVGAQFSNVDASGDPAALVRYLDDTAQRLRERKRASYALLDLKPGDAVLEVGCGRASDVLELERVVGPTGRTVGVDASEAMVEEARRRATAAGSRAQFEVARAESLPFPDATFDAVRTERVLMHVADPARAVDEIARVTKPSGRVVAIEPDHQMSALDAEDGKLCDRVFRGLNATLPSPRIGRQLRGLFVRSGLVHVDSRVAPLVFTSWADFQAVSGFSAELLRSAAGWGFATAEQIAALLSDFERRDAEGRFFACLVAMRCKGVRP